MSTTFLYTVNEVLKRLREPTMADLDDPTENQALVMALTNDAFRSVEDAWSWSANDKEIDLPMVAAQTQYSLTGTQNRAIIDEVHNVTENHKVKRKNKEWYRDQRLAGNIPSGSPEIWCPDGVDANGDTRIRVYPTPEGFDDLLIYLNQKSGQLVLTDDSYAIPSLPVIQLAHAFCVKERGESGGTQSGELFAQAKITLADAIAYDSGQEPEDTDWYVV